jgi:hypothetical protein
VHSSRDKRLLLGVPATVLLILMIAALARPQTGMGILPRKHLSQQASFNP